MIRIRTSLLMIVVIVFANMTNLGECSPLNTNDDLVCPGAERTVLVDGPADFMAIDVDQEHMITLDNHGVTKWKLEGANPPTALGSWFTPRGEWWSWDSALVYMTSEGYAFVYKPNERVMFFDVRGSTPKPIWQSNGDFPNPGANSITMGISFSDDLVVVRDGFEPVFFDISDPRNPFLIETTWPSGPPTAFDFALAGDLLIVSAWVISIWDVSDPAQPQLLSTLDPYASLGFGTTTWEVVASESMALMVMGMNTSYSGLFGVVAIDLSDPNNPEIHDVWSDLPWFMVRSLEIDGRRVDAVAARFNSSAAIEIVDFSDPAAPVLKTSAVLPSGGYRLKTEGNYSFVRATRVVHILDNNLQPTTTTPMAGVGETLAVNGDIAVQAHGAGGILVFDVSDPSQPIETGRLSLSGFAEDIAYDGQHAFVAGYTEGLHIVEIGDPTDPQLISSIDTMANAYDVAVSGSTVVVSTGGWQGDEVAQVFDVSDPAHPILAADVFTGEVLGGYSGIAIADGYAYLATGKHLYIIDIGNPYLASIISSVQVIASPSSYDDAHDVSISGGIAYVATQNSGTVIVDISVEKQPTIVATHSDLYSSHVNASGNRVSLTWAPHSVVDFSDHLSPIVRNFRPMRGNWGHAFVVDSLLVPNGPFLEVFSLDCIAPEALFAWVSSKNHVWFRETSRNWIEDFHWDFGDGSSSADRNPYHRFSESGRFEVTLTVTSTIGSDSESQFIVVEIENLFADDFESGNTEAWSQTTP